MKAAVLYAICLSLAVTAEAMDLKKEVNLKGMWRFEIGDQAAYADEAFDDSHWDTITAPGRWEDQGFPGYDGFAWYRKAFDLPRALQGEHLYLVLGRIDDVDHTYINGRLINGSGRLHPDYETAYASHRYYYLPAEFLHFDGPNVVAVQVYDDFESGGITAGDLGIFSRRDFPEMVVDLSGYWQFRTGDDPAWQSDSREISGWDSLIVPLKWEMQGYAEYDGYAWYRRTVEIDQEYRDETLILALGMIDDVDEVYFNGQRIGRTGHFPAAGEDISTNDWWQRERFYTIPRNLIRFDRPNTIAVRTFDAWIDGGIYDGVVGIMTRRSYLRYRNNSDNQLIDLLKKWFEPAE